MRSRRGARATAATCSTGTSGFAGEWSDAERCRWCCTTSWWSKPRADDLRNRQDPLIAALHTCAAIAVPADEDVEMLGSLGVASSRVSVGASAEALAALVTGAASAS